MQIKSIGIDLGKTTFHLIAPGDRSQLVIRKKFSRSQLLVYTANLRLSDRDGGWSGIRCLLDSRQDRSQA
jgi:hypothetical protein